MYNMNQFTVTGNITKKPESRVYMKGNISGKYVTHISLAVSRPFDKKKTDFFVFTAFGDLGYKMSKLNKGDKILIQSYVKNNIYEKDGKKVYGIDYIVTNYEVIKKKK